MIKEKLYSHKIFLLYGAMFVVLLICHLGIDLSYGDDGFFVNVLDDISLKEFLRNRYLWTTSRVVIEAIQMPLTVYAQWLWRILNSAVLVSIVWLINRLFAPKQTVRGILCCAALAAVVPLTAIMGAGWIATTANYVWTLAAGMTALLPIKKWIEEKDVRWWEYFIYLSAVIYATNHEQMAALLLGWYFVLGFYLMYEHKIKWQYFMLLAIAGNAVDFISKCPGNQWRKINDMQRYLPEFEKFSLTDKLFLGGLTTGHYYWTGKDGNWVMAVVCAVVLSAVIWKNRNSLKKWKTVVKIAITALPFVFHVLVGHLLKLLFHKGLLHKGLFWLGLFWNDKLPYESAYTEKYVVFEVIVFTGLFACLGLGVWWAMDRVKEKLLFTVMLMAGIASRVMVGLSPSVYASGDRTTFFATIMLLCIIFHIFIEMKASDLMHN